MNLKMKAALTLACAAMTSQVCAQISFYEHENYAGRSFTAQKQVNNLARYGFNDQASSVVISSARWEVCQDKDFGGRCVILRQGNYASLQAMGLNDRISSSRKVSTNEQFDDDRYGPAPVSSYDARRRNKERLYTAEVTSARAVTGSSQQRCWIEHEQSRDEQRGSSNNIPAALAGAVIGGVLGHQVGGGRGQDLATAGGAVAGAMVGNNLGSRNDSQTQGRDVQRCSNDRAPTQPEYWDVSYNFRGVNHRVQMTQRPGATVTVNGQGEPRI